MLQSLMVAHDKLEFQTKLLLLGRWFDVLNALLQAHFLAFS